MTIDISKLSKHRINQTISTLQKVVDRKGGFNLAYFSEYDTDEIHPCINSACVIGYQSLTPEWAEAGASSEHGTPMMYSGHVPKNTSPFATIWFTGNDFSIEDFVELEMMEPSDHTVASLLATGATFLAPGTKWKDLDYEVSDEICALLDIEPHSLDDIDDALFGAIYGDCGEAEDVTAEDAIEVLQWLLTLDITV